MRLLYISIQHDGYTQPVVTIYNEEKDKYIIVDGFHRYLTMKHNKDLYDLNKGLLPVVVIEKDDNDLMASTIRHNRARGKHAITGMSNIVFEMLQNGGEDEKICNEVGLESEELVRLKHVTGFSKLFEDVEYNKSWEHIKMLRLKNEYNKSQANGN